MRVLLVTGGAGFIGSNFIRYFLETNKDFIVVNYDKLTYAGNLNNLKEVEMLPTYRFVKGDICDSGEFNRTLKKYNPDYIINFAAESHVDRSISGPSVFGQTNFMEHLIYSSVLMNSGVAAVRTSVFCRSQRMRYMEVLRMTAIIL